MGNKVINGKGMVGYSFVNGRSNIGNRILASLLVAEAMWDNVLS